jgi:hypothetical protein
LSIVAVGIEVSPWRRTDLAPNHHRIGTLIVSTYARIVAGAVFETFSTALPITDFSPASAGWVTCPDGTPQGSIATDMAGVWTFAAPAALPPPDTRAAAQIALDKSDVTVGRCYEHGVAVPAGWTDYRAALRAHVSGGPTAVALPVAPAYPAGT